MKRIFNQETINKVGEKVLLFGWVHFVRKVGKMIFILLRDRSGLVQVVFLPANKELYEKAKELRSEFVVRVEGLVQKRPVKDINQNLVTGEIEILAQNLEILAEAKTLPFEISKDEKKEETKEELRLKYRYLDLRREKMKKNLIFRHKIVKFIRDFFDKNGFIEVETPILTKSTPEGARDFLVPSRIEPGKFFALPQAPQQYKELLMVAGLERYFQIAKCFRDEDTRFDRQPEFTQIDLEMSFVNENDILEIIEKMIIDLIKNVFPEKKIAKIPFPRISYQEATLKYKTDKPDLRNEKEKEDKNLLYFAWITDFPLFERDEKGNLAPKHNPFTSPREADLPLLDKNPEKVLARQYDLVLNGVELGGGAIRISDPNLLLKIFKILGHLEEEVKEKFGHLLEAFSYGVPPHGGIALGLDRLLMICLNEESIREVIAFPKTSDGKDLMMDSPSEVNKEQLKELKIKIE